MMRLSLSLVALALLAGCGTAPRHEAPTDAPSAAPLGTITSASIALPPDEETFAAGPEGDLINRNCLACHSVAMIRQQPPLTRKQWTATVTKMREAYGAPFEAAETEAIVSALMKTAPSKP